MPVAAPWKAPEGPNRSSAGTRPWNAAPAFWLGIAVAVVLDLPLAFLINWLRSQ